MEADHDVGFSGVVFGAGDAELLAFAADLLDAASPGLDKSATIERAGDQFIAGFGGVLPEKTSDLPALRQATGIAEIESVGMDAQLNRLAIDEVLMHQRVADEFPHRVLRVGIRFDARLVAVADRRDQVLEIQKLDQLLRLYEKRSVDLVVEEQVRVVRELADLRVAGRPPLLGFGVKQGSSGISVGRFM